MPPDLYSSSPPFLPYLLPSFPIHTLLSSHLLSLLNPTLADLQERPGVSEHLLPAGTRRPNFSGSDGEDYPAGRLGCSLNLPSSSSSVPPPSLPVHVQRPLPLLPLSFKDRVCCFRHAKMDNGGYSKICCTHHHPRKHYPSTQWKPPASLWPFPFLPPSRPPSLPLRENPRTSSLSSSRGFSLFLFPCALQASNNGADLC